MAALFIEFLTVIVLAMATNAAINIIDWLVLGHNESMPINSWRIVDYITSYILFCKISASAGSGAGLGFRTGSLTIDLGMTIALSISIN